MGRSRACLIPPPSVGVDDPGLPDAEYAAGGGLLPSPHAKLAGSTFQEWLDTQP